MSKFKIGDEVYYWTTHLPVKTKMVGVVHKIQGTRIYAWGPHGWMPEEKTYLISPSTFEVGKQYINRSVIKPVIFTVECILEKTSEAVFTYFSPHQEEIVSLTIKLSSFDKFKEYIPPPPEEWRALYYRPNSKPEVSAAYWGSEGACKTYHDDDDLPLGERNFMYAIRTDINAKKENSNGK